MWGAFAMQKLPTFLQQKYAIFQDRNFNVTLANNFDKFWTTGSWLFIRTHKSKFISFYIKVFYISICDVGCSLTIKFCLTLEVVTYPVQLIRLIWVSAQIQFENVIGSCKQNKGHTMSRGFSMIRATLFIPTLDTTTKFVILTIWLSRNLRLRGNI